MVLILMLLHTMYTNQWHRKGNYSNITAKTNTTRKDNTAWLVLEDMDAIELGNMDI